MVCLVLIIIVIDEKLYVYAVQCICHSVLSVICGVSVELSGFWNLVGTVHFAAVDVGGSCATSVDRFWVNQSSWCCYIFKPFC